MADGNRPAIDVDDIRIKTKFAHHRAGLGRKGFVGFHKANIADRPASLGQRLAGGGDGAGAHDLRIDTCRRPGGDTGQRLDTALSRLLFRHQKRGGGTIIQTGGVARRHGAFLVKGGAQLGHRFQ
ncbi:hypothetical protein D3C78_1225370 [compost metagenome]